VPLTFRSLISVTESPSFSSVPFASLTTSVIGFPGSHHGRSFSLSL
jgi:hypothetical protein